MDNYDKSMYLLQEKIYDNKELIEEILNKNKNITYEVEVQLEDPIKFLESIKGKKPKKYKCKYSIIIDKSEKDGKFKYLVEKLEDEEGLSSIQDITRYSIGIDNKRMPSYKKIESDLNYIMESILDGFNKEISKYK